MPRPAIASLLRCAEKGDVFHVIDTETTGLSPRENRVIELATVTLQAGRVAGRFETFIDPGVAVPRRITEITGITSAMLKGAPGPAEALRRWRAYLGDGGHFVAHNAGFDWGFLEAEFARAGMAWPFRKRFCTVELARHCLPGLRRHRLENLIAHFGIQVSDRHRALADVEATATVFLKCLEQLREAQPDSEAIAEPAPTEDPWAALLTWLRVRSVPTAALLEQQATFAGQEPDGAVVVRIAPIYKERLEARKAALVEEGLRAVLGDGATLRLEARSGVSG